ncbi:hypothetical protein [Persephonella atlantica]|nr:hypothetical protein [Persephonella atlantica]
MSAKVRIKRCGTKFLFSYQKKLRFASVRLPSFFKRYSRITSR